MEETTRTVYLVKGKFQAVANALAEDFWLNFETLGEAINAHIVMSAWLAGGAAVGPVILAQQFLRRDGAVLSLDQYIWHRVISDQPAYDMSSGQEIW